MLKYIDNEFAVQLLNCNFIDYVIDPVKNDALDVDQYNDQFFKDEAESFIKEHNEKVRRMKMIKVYQKSAVKPRASARGYKAPNRGYSGFQCIV